VRDGHDALGTRIEAAVHKGAEKTGQIVTAELHQPLASMTALLEKSAADQQSGVQELLTGTLEQFASRLEDVVGDKLGTAAGHVTAAADLIGTALTDAPKAMEVASASVATTLERSGAEAREALVATTTGVRATIESASIEASRAIEATTHGARETMEATLAGVRATIEESGTATRDTLAAIADAATPMVGHAERISAASAALATSIEQGERTLDGAIERLRAVGVSLTAAVASADAAAAALNGAASASRGGSEATTQAAGELRAAGEAIGKGTSELARATEIQRSENDTRQALAEAVQRSAAELRVAQESLDDFLAGLSSALEASHREFAQRLTETVTRANSAIADELARATTAVGQAVGFLNEAIEDELGPTVDGLVTELQRIVPTTATSRS
jgi:hypothetical protein